jgi:hypothetical protein
MSLTTTVSAAPDIIEHSGTNNIILEIFFAKKLENQYSFNSNYAEKRSLKKHCDVWHKIGETRRNS